jgi:hypothetical protein
MIRTLFLAIACAFVAAAPTFATAPASNAGGAEPTVGAATVPHLYDNCTNYNKKYPHGVGKAGARDKTKSKTAESVTTFKRRLSGIPRRRVLACPLDDPLDSA